MVTPLNAWWTGPELEYGLADSGTKVAFLDAERLERVRPHLHNCPDLKWVYVAREHDELIEALGAAPIAIEQPHDPAALWRWRDGFNGVVSAVRGAKVSEDVAFPIERLCEALERFEQIASSHGLRSCAWGHGGDGNVHATVLVDPSSPAELDAADATSAELFALVRALGGSIAAEHGVGLLKAGLLAAQWDARTVQLHEEIKRVFDPKTLLNPGKKLAR